MWIHIEDIVHECVSSDINECTENLDDCVQICDNTIGSYECSCENGYTLAADGRSCDDVNECLLNTDQCQQGCNNTIGSFVCYCLPGFELASDGRSCTDIDECLITPPLCSQNCTNVPGMIQPHINSFP